MTVFQLRELVLHSPDGRQLSTSIDFTFQQKFYALTGRNGCGKSLLMAVMAGAFTAQAGCVAAYQSFIWLPQFVIRDGLSLQQALLKGNLGLAAKVTALQRLQRGQGKMSDIECIADDWQLLDELAQHLPYGLKIDQNWGFLSGGERMRCLLQTVLDQNDFLLLDEPNNHLDIQTRLWLVKQLQQHKAGALVISHDPQLLQQADVILHLSTDGLECFTQGFAEYRRTLLARRQRLCQQAVQQKRQLMDVQQQQRQCQLIAERRSRRGQQQVRDGSQGKALGDYRARRASQALGQANRRWQHRQYQLEQQKYYVEKQHKSRLANGHLGAVYKLWIQQAILPNSNDLAIDIHWQPGQKIWLRGANGSGKTTLLDCIAGRKTFNSGDYVLPSRCVYIDQQVSCLPLHESAVDALKQHLCGLELSEICTLLASMGLVGASISQPLQHLSGGERMKVALLLAHQTQAFLLLDEPDNHLDLHAQEELIEWLNNNKAGFILVTHNSLLANEVKDLLPYELPTSRH